MLRKNTLLNFLEFLHLIIIIIAVGSFYIMQDQDGPDLFFNVDRLFVGDFFKNLLYENGSVKDWIFP